MVRFTCRRLCFGFCRASLIFCYSVFAIVFDILPVLNLFRYKHFDRIMAKKNFAIMSSVPTRVRATHIFVGSGSYVTDVVLPVLKQMAGKQKRLRGHLHVSALMLRRIYSSFAVYP
jgi:hypothetical protein